MSNPRFVKSTAENQCNSTEMIVALHNIRRPLGDGQEAWLISRKRLVRLIGKGMSPAIADRLRRYVLIVNASSSTRSARVVRIERRPFRKRYLYNWRDRPASGAGLPIQMNPAQ